MKRKKIIEKTFPYIDLQKVDMGIAMNHFEHYLKTSDLIIKWSSDSNGKLLGKENMQYIATAEVQ